MQAFDFETGLPKRFVRMESWPLTDRLSRPFWDYLGRAALESFVPTKTTEGFLVMFDRSATHTLRFSHGWKSKAQVDVLSFRIRTWTAVCYIISQDFTF